MSTEIIARLYFDEGTLPPHEIFCRIARTVAAWPQASGEMHGLKVFSRNRHSVSVRREERLPVDRLCAATAGLGKGDELLSTTTSFRCWRFPKGEPQAGSVVSWIEAWGDEWSRAHHEDRRVGGAAAFTVSEVGAFCALPDSDTTPRRKEINERVEENLDALTGLFFRLIEDLAPRSLKVFTSQGLSLPFNAHLLYHRDEGDVLDDLALIADVWDRGLPAHRIGPLRERRADDMGPAFHTWRSAMQREQLWSDLAALMPRRDRVTPAIVRQLLVSGRFDTYTMPFGTMLLEYPDFFNAFLARFYLEVLSATPSGE